MGSGLYFRVQDLPERYQRQVAVKTSPKTASDVMRAMGFGDMAVEDAVKRSKTPKKAPTPLPTAQIGMDGCHPSGKLVERPYEPESPSPPPTREIRGEMSKPERLFQDEILHGAGRYEAFTLHLAGGSRYTPDFFYMDGTTPVLVEVKGDYRLGSEGRARTAFLEAAAQFPIFRFVWAQLRKDKTWDMKMEIPADSESPA